MLQPVESPLHVSLYPMLAIVLLGAGTATAGCFVVYEVTKTKSTRRLLDELVIALLSSFFLGLGLFFLMMWTGLYV
eukprot:evm.model.scf_1772.5 EVM.evm.TU.scf_1772.5   scf_1772:17723-19262(+)